MNSRQDELTAGHIQVGLVYLRMLGATDARAYLRSVGVPDHTIQRILNSDNHRPLGQQPAAPRKAAGNAH